MFPVAAPRLSVNLRRWGRGALACSALGVAVGLVACGGGTRQNFFAPTKIVAFGDENSAFSDFTSPSFLKPDGTPGAILKGLTYTVHDATVKTPVVCANTTGAQPGTPAADCELTNGGTVTSPTLNGFYGFTFFSVTKLEVEGGNQRTTSTIYDCGVPRIWVHVMARAYGLGFNGQCALDPFGGAVSYAVNGAKVDDVIAQMAAKRGELGSGVLVTVMAGQNDILEQYAAIRASGTSKAAAIAELQARADRMADAVKGVIGTGARVVLSLTPSLNDSPKAVTAGEDAALLSELVVTFNDRLYVRGLANVSGRSLVGVNPDSFTNNNTRNRSFVHSTALCNTTGLIKPDGTVATGAIDDVLFCTTSNIVPGGSLNSYIWADSVHYAPAGHSLIGALAYNRARNQL